MTWTGIGVDIAVLERLEACVAAERQKELEAFLGLAARIPDPKTGAPLNPDIARINVASPLQIRQLLFGNDGPSVEWVRNTSSGELMEPSRSFSVDKTSSVTIRGLGLKPVPGRAFVTDAGWPSTSPGL